MVTADVGAAHGRLVGQRVIRALVGATVTSIRLFLFDSRSDIACYCHRAERCAVPIMDQRKGHFNVEFMPRLVHRSRQRRAAMQPGAATRHRRFEAAPVCALQMLRDGQIKALAKYLDGTVAE